MIERDFPNGKKHRKAKAKAEATAIDGMKKKTKRKAEDRQTSSQA